jgi:hypothetical protein
MPGGAGREAPRADRLQRRNIPATRFGDHRGMTDIAALPPSTAGAALAARDRIEHLAYGAARDERASAKLAKAALFEEALLAALKARFAELRLVAR